MATFRWSTVAMAHFSNLLLSARMECTTVGFRELRSHVKAVKAGAPYATSSRSIDEGERSESPQRLPEFPHLDVGGTTQRCNQDQVLEQKKQFDALCAVVRREHQQLQARERSIRSIEHTLEGELQRVAGKERNLDSRILEITRLEARLHEALLQQEQQHQKEPQEAETVAPNNIQDDREAIHDLREKKLAFSLAQVNEKKKHLQAKERALNEKEAELASLQAKLERKDRDTDARLNLMEDELRAHIQRMANVEAAILELKAQSARLEEREVNLVYRERASTAQAIALEQFQQLLSQQHECCLMIQEDYLARGVYLQERITAATLKTTANDPSPQDNDREGRRRQTTEQQLPKDRPQRVKRKGTLGRFFK